MSDQLVTGLITVAIAIVSLAMLSVVLSNSANTAGVVQATTGGFATDLEAAVSPITGGSALSGLSSTSLGSMGNF